LFFAGALNLLDRLGEWVGSHVEMVEGDEQRYCFVRMADRGNRIIAGILTCRAQPVRNAAFAACTLVR
jgi:hypothetical protein